MKQCNILILLLFGGFLQFLDAETLYLSSFLPSEQYTCTERENMRVYVDNRYRGLQNRQRRIFLEKAGDITDDFYQGSVYLLKNMRRDSTLVSQPIDNSFPVQCTIDTSGAAGRDQLALPLRTGFPVLREGVIKPGDSWKADGRDSLFTTTLEYIDTPFHCTYVYRGEDIIFEKVAQIIEFEYSFYDSSPYTSEEIEIRGRASGEIALFENDLEGFFIKERIIRHFIKPDGKVEKREEGFRLTWGQGITRGQIDDLEKKITGLLEETDSGGDDLQDGVQNREMDEVLSKTGTEKDDKKIEVERTAEGIKLNLPSIHFYPDEARILPDERERLDRLSRILLENSERDFMVKGHTADVGTKESQYLLSMERAKTIIEELAKRGLSEDKFIFMGLGGDEPVAENDTEEGREKNRRVEVYILW